MRATISALIAATLVPALPAVAANGLISPAIPAPPGSLPSGPGINFTSAPALRGITMVQSRDSVIVKFPTVANARDFRNTREFQCANSGDTILNIQWRLTPR